MPLSSTWSAALAMMAVAVLFAIGCSSESPAQAPASELVSPTPTPVPTLTPAPPTPSAARVVFPDDEGPHDTPIEWWYFNGMLRDGAGGEYSYHFVTFQSEGTPEATPHLLQATLGDHRSGAHYAAETLGLAPVHPEATGVDIATGDWLMRGGPDGYDMRFQISGPDGPIDLELSAVSQREPVLHGGSGLVDMGPEAGSTYYYSRTRLAVSGWIEDAGGRREVSGPGWMDHQWGDITRRDIGWDWSSIQLDDGSDLMVAVIWDPDGRRRLAGHGTYREPDGDVSHYDEDEISITAQGAWASPDTGIEYPSGWRVKVAPLGLDLELTPFVEQAEFTSGVIRVSYWEGAVSVSGQRGGQPVTGWGFVELVGYDPNQPESGS